MVSKPYLFLFDKYITNSEELIKLIGSFKNDVILVGAVDNNTARKHMHDTFYDERVPSLVYIDTGNGDGGVTCC